jgi:carboxyl-terminal processing protease
MGAMLFFIGGCAIGQSRYSPLALIGSAAERRVQTADAFKPFWETLELIHEDYFDQPLDEDLLAKGAIDGMLSSLGDPNTRYLPPDQEAAARNAMDGHLEGIGAEVTTIEGAIVIVAPYEGSPAEEAGILAGDILRKADGVELTGMNPSEAASLVRGLAGTPVLLEIERDGTILEIEVIRGVINIPSVRGEILADDIAYIRLSRFGNESGKELADLVDTLSEDNPSGMILDLRGNPGGSLSTAVDVADQFLDDGTVLVERFGNGDEKVYESREEGDAQDLPLVVIIDQGSASASEVVAGAVQNRQRGILVGETSFGKGTVQVWKELSNGGGVRITVARWLTPNEEWIHEQGIEPDIRVELNDPAGEELYDSQLQAAIDYLKDGTLMESASLETG